MGIFIICEICRIHGRLAGRVKQVSVGEFMGVWRVILSSRSAGTAHHIAHNLIDFGPVPAGPSLKPPDEFIFLASHKL